MALGIEWAAGFFEGEGSASIYTKTGKNAKFLQLTVSQVDRKPLDEFCKIVSLGKVRGPYGPYAGQLNKKPIYVWKAVGNEAVEAAGQLLPFLFGKGRQVLEAVTEYAIYKEGLNGPKNAP